MNFSNNTSSIYLPMKAFLLKSFKIGTASIALMYAAVTLHAQQGTAGNGTSPVLPVSSDVLNQAKGLTLAGNTAAAEALLLTHATTQPQTLRWYQECGRNMTRLTISLAATGNQDAQRAVAGRALAYLVAAEAATTDGVTLSNVRLNQGVLQERYLGDLAGAKLSYQRALAADPGNNLAAEGLARLQRIADAESARMGRKGARN
jgi:hypothetical protein